MIRTVITPQQQNITIDLPQEYIGKKVEVIAFTLEDIEPVDKPTTHLVSEKVLAKDWLTPEEDASWHNL
jgi:hypothetical protein